MKRFSTFLPLAATVLLASCDQVQEARNTYNAVASTARAAKNMGAALEASQKKRTERVERGDTVSLNYKDLQRYLPKQVNGFTPVGEPTGESVNMQGFSYSSCGQIYTKGDQRLKVLLVDYNGANTLYAGATAMMSAGFAQEDADQLMRGCDLGVPNVKGWETLEKKEHNASVALGVGDRFLVTVESNKQDDTEFVKQVARNIDLAALAKL